VCAAIAAWALVRALPVLALSEVFFFGEEREKGAVAVLLRGWWSGAGGLSWTDLPYHPYEGGGFCASHVKALAFALVGENVLAHKLAAIAWGALVLTAVLWCVWRHLGPRSARWCAALLVFAPEHVQRESLLHLGIHFEALVFVFWLFAGTLELVQSRERWRWTATFRLGWVAGFGLWFSLQLALPIALAAAALGLAAWRARRAPHASVRACAAALGGFASGAAPLAAMAHAVGWGVFDVHGAEVGGPGGFGRLAGFLASAAAEVAGDPTTLVGAAALTVAAAVGLGAALQRQATRAAGALCAAYLALWLAAAGASGLVPERLGHWFALLRWAPPVVTAIALAAHGIAVLTAAGRRPLAVFGVTLGVAALGGGALATARIVREGDLAAARSNLATLRAAPGVAWAEAFGKLAPRWRRGSGGEAAALAAFATHTRALGRRTDPEALWSGFAAGSAVGDTRGCAEALAALYGPLEAALDLEGPASGPLAVPEGALRRWLTLGLGALAARDAGLAEGWLALAAAGQELDLLTAEALGRYGSGGGLHPAFVAREAEAVRGHRAGPAYLRGLGARAVDALVLGPYGRLAGGPGGQGLTLRPAAARAWLAEVLPAADAAHALAGFDAALALRFR